MSVIESPLLPDAFSRGLRLAPLVFVAHALEESPGFVAWFNAHVQNGITPGLFWSVNAAGLVITLVVSLASFADRAPGVDALVVAWLSFLMLTNGLFHLTAAIVDRAYVPGLVTALFLYLPYCAWMGRQLVRTGRARPALHAAAAVLGAVPMAVHGYRILFLGTRLF